jgi:hypothetical protein
MNSLTIALTTYAVAAVISMGTAGIIKLIVVLLGIGKGKKA